MEDDPDINIGQLIFRIGVIGFVSSILLTIVGLMIV